jgi:hypothetical protein
MSEGFSFKNIQEEHILNPHWHFGQIDQAIARGYRYKSHQDLLNLGYRPNLNIYLYASYNSKSNILINENTVVDTDIEIWKIAQNKDLDIKLCENFLKKLAVDCTFNYKNNIKNAFYNYKRDCDYTECTYDCDFVNNINNNDNIDKYSLRINDIDYSTYESFYFERSDFFNVIRDEIFKIFKKYNSIKQTKLFDLLKKNIDTNIYYVNDSYIFYTLYNIIYKKIILKNKFDLNCQLNFYKNIYFLTDDSCFFKNIFNYNNFYLEYPTFPVQKLLKDENILFSSTQKRKDELNNELIRKIKEKLESNSMKEDIIEILKNFYYKDENDKVLVKQNLKIFSSIIEILFLLKNSKNKFFYFERKNSYEFEQDKNNQYYKDNSLNNILFITPFSNFFIEKFQNEDDFFLLSWYGFNIKTNVFFKFLKKIENTYRSFSFKILNKNKIKKQNEEEKDEDDEDFINAIFGRKEDETIVEKRNIEILSDIFELNELQKDIKLLENNKIEYLGYYNFVDKKTIPQFNIWSRKDFINKNNYTGQYYGSYHIDDLMKIGDDIFGKKIKENFTKDEIGEKIEKKIDILKFPHLLKFIFYDQKEKNVNFIGVENLLIKEI